MSLAPVQRRFTQTDSIVLKSGSFSLNRDKEKAPLLQVQDLRLEERISIVFGVFNLKPIAEIVEDYAMGELHSFHEMRSSIREKISKQYHTFSISWMPVTTAVMIMGEKPFNPTGYYEARFNSNDKGLIIFEYNILKKYPPQFQNIGSYFSFIGDGVSRSFFIFSSKEKVITKMEVFHLIVPPTNNWKQPSPNPLEFRLNELIQKYYEFLKKQNQKRSQLKNSLKLQESKTLK